MAKKKSPSSATKQHQQAPSTAVAASEPPVNCTEVSDGTSYDSSTFWTILRLVLVAVSTKVAYEIRLYAINEYGLVIHEFDPWFNYRATEYLGEHGLKAFFEWYDYMSWYPLGRPVGTTIYPGMQITSVIIHRVLNDYLGIVMSLNDVCCYVPAWFGVLATLLVGLLTAECSGSSNAGAFASLVMSCIPAHTMRSVGGGYDNESIAVTAMSLTFYFWVRALRDDHSAKPFGILAGLAYIYMVAAWGGYVFVINMIGVHAIFLVLSQRFSRKAYWAYTLLFSIGTLGAIQIPVVGLTPVKSLEQIGPLGVFGIYQVLYVCEIIKDQRKLNESGLRKLQVQALMVAGGAGIFMMMLLWPTGYFGPLSSRVRGLFVQHTRTGNPLVDSVAEHQPASPKAYFQYLFYTVYLAPVGYVNTFFHKTDAMIFLPLYATVAYFFSAKMVRLIILLGPIVSCLSGIALAMFGKWIVDQFFGPPDPETPQNQAPKKGRSKHPLGPEAEELQEQFATMYYQNKTGRKWIAIAFFYFIVVRSIEFSQYAQHMAKMMSNPSIMYHAQLQDGSKILVDDYREAYFWLRDNTPDDARVMAWWDYGYQITGIANRTSIADGNTWNHEHIATLGRCLVSEEKFAHSMIIHLADYVLVWTGGGGDDVAKMPHIARIANSVYSTVCGEDDPLCSKLGFKDSQRTPSDFMAQTLIYKLHSGGQRAGTVVDPSLFENVFSSKYNKVRIWKVKDVDEESRAWNADPVNRICDPPGSWICKGQYPPKFQKFISEKKDFAQLEDFNREKDVDADAYQKKYHESMQNKGSKPKH